MNVLWMKASTVATLGLLCCSTALAQIGTVAAVNRDMEGTPPELEKRLLAIGDGIVSNERVQTSSQGSGQLLFVDQTSLTVAADSDIILDKYIYDPDQGTGDIALSIARGAARFIGGSITKSRTATIRTPSATIGIRGGMALVEVDGGKTKVTNVASISITVETFGDADGDGFDDGPGTTAGGDNDGGQQRQPQSRVVLTRTSSTATSDASGTSFTGIASDEELASAYQSFEGGGEGGLAEAPDSQTVNDGAEEIAVQNSGTQGGAQNQPVTTTGEQTNNDDTTVAPDLADPAELAELADPTDLDIGGVAGFAAIPDPADIAVLSGTAVYNGVASGTLVDLKGILPDSNVTGTSALLYDFDQRLGVLELDITPGTFTVEVGADAANIANFSGTDTIFGGPDTISAQGGFRSSPTDVAASVEGTFDLNLQTQFQQVTGTFGGDR